MRILVLSRTETLRTAISPNITPVEFLGQNHGRPGEVGPVVPDGLPESKLEGVVQPRNPVAWKMGVKRAWRTLL